MSIFYTDMLAVLRAAGCRVAENGTTDGWQTRARSSGGFAAPPLGIQWHHTASSSSPAGDLSYMIDGSPDAPVGNLLLDRDGVFWPIAAGAANTAGKGGPVTMSRGVVDVDTGNSRTFAFEVANNGVGEPWPAVQVDAYFAGSNALNAHFGNQPTDVFTHSLGAGNGWTDRKIDPATAAAVQGPWRPGSVNSSGTWSLDDIRAELARRAGTLPPPQPQPGPDPGPPQPFTEEDSMIIALDQNGTAWLGDTLTRRRIIDSSEFDNLVILAKGAARIVNTSGQRVDGWGNVATVGPDMLDAIGRET